MNLKNFTKITSITDRVFEDINTICKGDLKRVIIEKMSDGSIETEVRTFNRKPIKKGKKNEKDK